MNTIPLLPQPAVAFELLQQWEGTVTDVRRGEFTALLRNLSDPDDPVRNDADFDLEEISPGDAHLVVPGAVFTWTIARETLPHGQRRNVDFIRFLRLPAWTAREAEAIEARAKELEERFG